MTDDLIAYFLTWTVYGTFLQGDTRGWKQRRQGKQLPQPRLSQWRLERLKHPILLLTPDQRLAVQDVVASHCDHRGWKLWAASCRTNHVHVVVSANNYSGAQVRDQLKANATRVLRSSCDALQGRPVWTRGGDWQCVNSERELDDVISYVSDAQDRMSLPK